jgi:hypothetical protein
MGRAIDKNVVYDVGAVLPSCFEACRIGGCVITSIRFGEILTEGATCQQTATKHGKIAVRISKPLKLEEFATTQYGSLKGFREYNLNNTEDFHNMDSGTAPNAALGVASRLIEQGVCLYDGGPTHVDWAKDASIGETVRENRNKGLSDFHIPMFNEEGI